MKLERMVACVLLCFGLPAASEEVAERRAFRVIDEVGAVLDRFRFEPSVREVQEAAIRQAGIDPAMLRSWRSRSRLAALGPQVRGEYRQIERDDRRLRTGGGLPDLLNDNLALDARVLGRVHWNLDRLIFNPDELRVSREVADLVRLRAGLVDQVTRLYFERRRLQVELVLGESMELTDRLRAELRLEELTADLDAITGGWFSSALERAERMAKW